MGVQGVSRPRIGPVTRATTVCGVSYSPQNVGTANGPVPIMTSRMEVFSFQFSVFSFPAEH